MVNESGEAIVEINMLLAIAGGRKLWHKNVVGSQALERK